MPLPTPPREVRLARLGQFLDALGQIAAAYVTYDPTASGMSATDIQAAVDELAAAVGGGSGEFTLDTPNNTLRFKPGYTLIGSEAGDAVTDDAYFYATQSSGINKVGIGAYGSSGSSSIDINEGEISMNASAGFVAFVSSGAIYALSGGDGLAFPSLASAPSSPLENQTYYDETLHKVRTWDGSAWQNHW